MAFLSASVATNTCILDSLLILAQKVILERLEEQCVVPEVKLGSSEFKQDLKLLIDFAGTLIHHY